MIEEEILNNNTLIAAFMHLEELFNVEVRNGKLMFRNQLNDLMPVKYHSSWDWLMPVVEKIESFDTGTIIIRFLKFEGLQTAIFSPYNEEKIIPAIVKRCDTKLEAVYNTVVAFIKWFNQQ